MFKFGAKQKITKSGSSNQNHLMTEKLAPKFKYQPGFGNLFVSEVLEGAVPIGRNSPQVCPYGLVAEQLSGTAFTKPRVCNQKRYVLLLLTT
jgi:homogentisate 1,2-dioxygenase